MWTTFYHLGDFSEKAKFGEAKKAIFPKIEIEPFLKRNFQIIKLGYYQINEILAFFYFCVSLALKCIEKVTNFERS